MSKQSFSLRGSVVPLITPLNADEEVDVKPLQQLISFQRENGTDALFLLGSCGEGPCLTDSARDRLLDAVLELNPGLPVFVGVAETATRRAVLWARRAARQQVDALVVMMPIFHWLKNPPEMIDHVQAIYDATEKPLILYNFPVKTDGVAIPLDVVRILRQKKRILGIKDSSGDLGYIQKLIEIRQELGDLSVMNGEMRTAFQALELGADGLVMSYTNVEPNICKEMIRAVGTGDTQKAKELQQRMLCVWNEFGPEVNPVMKVKAILSARGLCQPICCSPVRSIGPLIPKSLQEVQS